MTTTELFANAKLPDEPTKVEEKAPEEGPKIKSDGAPAGRLFGWSLPVVGLVAGAGLWAVSPMAAMWTTGGTVAAGGLGWGVHRWRKKRGAKPNSSRRRTRSWTLRWGRIGGGRAGHSAARRGSLFGGRRSSTGAGFGRSAGRGLLGRGRSSGGRLGGGRSGGRPLGGGRGRGLLGGRGSGRAFGGSGRRAGLLGGGRRSTAGGRTGVGTGRSGRKGFGRLFGGSRGSGLGGRSGVGGRRGSGRGGLLGGKRLLGRGRSGSGRGASHGRGGGHSTTRGLRKLGRVLSRGKASASKSRSGKAASSGGKAGFGRRLARSSMGAIRRGRAKSGGQGMRRLMRLGRGKASSGGSRRSRRGAKPGSRGTPGVGRLGGSVAAKAARAAKTRAGSRRRKVAGSGRASKNQPTTQSAGRFSRAKTAIRKLSGRAKKTSTAAASPSGAKRTSKRATSKNAGRGFAARSGRHPGFRRGESRKIGLRRQARSASPTPVNQKPKTMRTRPGQLSRPGLSVNIPVDDGGFFSPPNAKMADFPRPAHTPKPAAHHPTPDADNGFDDAGFPATPAGTGNTSQRSTFMSTPTIAGTGYASHVDPSTPETLAKTCNEVADTATSSAIALEEEAQNMRAEAASMQGKEGMAEAAANLLREASFREEAAQIRRGIAAQYAEYATDAQARAAS